MIGSPVRDPIGDHLLTPQNAALCVIDYQPSQFAGVRSIDHDLLLENIVSTVRTAKAFGLPIVHSTINVATGRGQPTVPELAELLADDSPIDRTTTNAWEDPEFLAAVRATGRRKLILCALWTEICMTFPALDALREGYDVYPVVDAIGGTSEEAHRAGLDRVLQAGAKPVGWVSLAVELQRDWAREETVADVIQIVLTDAAQSVTVAAARIRELLLANLFAVFNERDPDRRSAAIATNYTEDVIWTDPDGTTQGHQALNERAQQLLDRSPDFVFSPAGQVHVSRDLGLLAFSLGVPEQPPAVNGVDVALVRDGRIAVLHTLLTGEG